MSSVAEILKLYKFFVPNFQDNGKTSFLKTYLQSPLITTEKKVPPPIASYDERCCGKK